MNSFVFRLDEGQTLSGLLDSWCQHHQCCRVSCDSRPPIPGDNDEWRNSWCDDPRSMAVRDDILQGLDGEWQRIRWFYYNDNAQEISIRVYDRGHLDSYAQGEGEARYYLQEDSHNWRKQQWGKEQFRYLIVRGYFFGPKPQPPGHQLALDTNRKNHRSQEVILGANRVAQLNQYIQNHPDEELKLRLIAESPIRVWQATRAPASHLLERPITNIEPAADPGWRFDYFEHQDRNHRP